MKLQGFCARVLQNYGDREERRAHYGAKNYIYMCSYKVYQREGGVTQALHLAQKVER